ncbi:hypothetical protein [Streptomyces sp. TE5632]
MTNTVCARLLKVTVGSMKTMFLVASMVFMSASADCATPSSSSSLDVAVRLSMRTAGGVIAVACSMR